MPWWSQRASGPSLLPGPGQEGDDVMLGDRLDRVDRGDVDLAEDVGVIGRADRWRRRRPESPRRWPIASAAKTSMANQMR